MDEKKFTHAIEKAAKDSVNDTTDANLSQVKAMLESKEARKKADTIVRNKMTSDLD